MADALDEARRLCAAATQGEWIAGELDGKPAVMTTAPGVAFVCVTLRGPVEANAALIAAAPRLLAALCDELALRRELDEVLARLTAARAALAAWEGEGSPRSPARRRKRNGSRGATT